MRKPRPKPIPIQSAAQRARTYRRWVLSWNLIFDDIKTIAHHRDLYRKVTAMIDAKPALRVPSPFYDWMQFAYFRSQATAIRRLVDWDRRSLSLIRLIEDIIDHPEVLTRRRFVGLYPKQLRTDLAHRDFAKTAVGYGGQSQNYCSAHPHLQRPTRRASGPAAPPGAASTPPRARRADDYEAHLAPDLHSPPAARRCSRAAARLALRDEALEVAGSAFAGQSSDDQSEPHI